MTVKQQAFAAPTVLRKQPKRREAPRKRDYFCLCSLRSLIFITSVLPKLLGTSLKLHLFESLQAGYLLNTHTHTHTHCVIVWRLKCCGAAELLPYIAEVFANWRQKWVKTQPANRDTGCT